MTVSKLDRFGSIPKLEGRQKGVQNKSTRERNALMREHLLKTNVIFKAVNEISARLDSNPESVKMSELINIIAKVSPFLYQTVSDESIEEVVERITSREDAEKEVNEIMNIVTQLRAVK